LRPSSVFVMCASAHHDPPPPPRPLTIANSNKHHRWWDLTIVTYPYQTYKALSPYFGMKTFWCSQWDETCSYYHPLLNIFLDIVVLLTDTYTYCVQSSVFLLRHVNWTYSRWACIMCYCWFAREVFSILHLKFHSTNLLHKSYFKKTLGEDRCIQDFGGETQENETICET